ncbi:hypothetical protein [Ferrovum sp.]|uniref:hypothetical protein n=1 Tax=Ferrovum sp. TaxID=2609467 RepID=UPI00260CF340|nr:hypothetical protein [Ferrovum sp.]
MKLSLGVIDIPYPEEEVTTGEVAGILEAHYGVMRVFVEEYEDKITQAVEEKMLGLIQNVKLGGPPPTDDIDFPEIEKDFREYLDRSEWEKISGKPTKAALLGISKRKKSLSYGERRPSFIDTGLYQKSMRVWTEK